MSKSVFPGMPFSELIFPSRCLVCKRISREIICSECLSRVSPVPIPVCKICGSPVEKSNICFRCRQNLPYFSRARSYALYDGVIKTAIIRFKFEKKKRIGEFLGNLLGEFALNLNWKMDVIVPIPLSDRRLKERGFNQSEILALEVGKILKLPVSSGLVRIKETVPSISLSPAERIKNINKAFLLSDRDLKGKRVLLVDDVYTTGATVNEAGKTLLERGIKEVRVLTLARDLKI
ncbi:MAG TPA: ComF family protein [bacterium]|nr:ComF family protein [bacterium]